MTTDNPNLHYELKDVGLRAQATAIGLVQLCKELQLAGVLSDDAVGRIKTAIADEIALTAPRSIRRDAFRQDVCTRLDEIFSGGKDLGTGEGLAYRTENAEPVG
ncbi:hypothetical protein [Altericroceibacterium endophyticum]|uniref:Uncharacterized protein n=1 Tax=Altericroceibacterium endophyticum TaxID=1808508 RepID=A0A6I4T7M5_9SPHN|nr:hypothetical protein [Altericroceibacterium endophyticum]MXO67164.1 hypothetical protein [Altericroceibacterium endophyticum]